MLAGRETIARVVGKRRRNLHRDVLLRRISLSAVPDGKVRSLDAEKKEEEELAAPDVSAKEWVECPVCGKSIRGDSYRVNCHLDSCLVRGKKRKLTQTTLLQLNFCTKSSRESSAHESAIPQDNTIELQRDGTGDCEVVNGLTGVSCRRSDDVLEPGLILPNVEGTGKISTENKEDKGIEYSFKCTAISSTSVPDNSMDETCHFNLLETLSTAMIETVIVGYKFQNEANLFQGARVCILRDYGNAKDSHALKVVYSDSGREVMVGYLRRELAKYLSPLIDRFRMRLEGSVISNFDASGGIPVRLICREIEEHNELESREVLRWKNVWEDALRVVEDEKMYPPNMVKYQRNFHVMVQEVLNRHSPLLEDEEKTFLWNFNALSDDSQRIFIRLYTRKASHMQKWVMLSKQSRSSNWQGMLAI